MRKLFLLYILLAGLSGFAQTNNNAIIYADQYTTLSYQQIVDTVCPSTGCTIYATSANASRTIGALDPGHNLPANMSKLVTLYLGPYTYSVDMITVRRGLRIIGMGATPTGTILQSVPIAPHTANQAMFVLGPESNNQTTDVYFYGFRLYATATNTAQYGMLFDVSTLTDAGLVHSTFENLYFGGPSPTQGFHGSAIFLNAPHNNPAVVAANQLLSFRNIWALRPSTSPQPGPDLRIEGSNGQIDCIECHFDGWTFPTTDTWANVYIGNTDGGTSAPYSIHFFDLTSQSANVGVQIAGAQNVTFIGSHHEGLNGAYLISDGGASTTRGVLISNSLFAGNVGHASGAGYIVSANNAQSIVLDTPLIFGNSSNQPPDAIVVGTTSYNVSVRNAHNTNGVVPFFSTFVGNLSVTGTLSKSAGSFKIDHPLDPENKYLSHSFVESPDMMNIYNGIIALDSKGKATVTMPNYFEALNQDFRYQLTCLGGYAPIFVSHEIKNNAFDIAGGKPGMKVSWQVTGVRHDAYANAHRIVVEEQKTSGERGHLINPDLPDNPKDALLH